MPVSFRGWEQPIPYDECTVGVDVEGDLGLRNGRSISFVICELPWKWGLKEQGMGMVGLF